MYIIHKVFYIHIDMFIYIYIYVQNIYILYIYIYIYILYIYIYISFNVVERFTKRRNVLKIFFYFFEYPMYSRNIFNKDCFCFSLVNIYIYNI